MNLWEIWVTVTIVLWLVFVSLTFFWKKNETLAKHKRFVDQMPSMLSTFGVLGTFIGIAIGLSSFDASTAETMDTSIRGLLDGMKTAFFTSLAGMGCSMVLQQIISLVRDKDEKKSDVATATTKIVEALGAMQKSMEAQNALQDQNQMNFYKVATPLIQTIHNNIESMSKNTDALSLALQAVSTELTSLKDLTSSKLDQAFSTFTSNADATQKVIAQEVGTLGEKLHTEVTDVENQMDKTNVMLNEKFQEFSELLKKSNTEALVEVMKGVTEEFEKQMSTLINRLVQENFQKLNESVERLNTWQVENKEMIENLTSQYKEMSNQFEGTSTTLSAVGEDTRNLLSDGGKLQQIVTTLKDVMVDDQKFKEITQNLSSAAESNKDANEEFRNSSEQLTKWVLKQKDFAEAISVLMKKLEEINKINDYSDKFWAETKRGMNDSIGVLKNGSTMLQNQISNLDQTFYARLSATLSELDNLITSLMQSKK